MIVYTVIIAYLASFSFASNDKNEIGCTITDNPLQANCSYLKNLHHVPQNLNPGLKILDVSNIRLQGRLKDDFAPYSQLETLIIRDNLIETVSDKTLFRLKNLVNVDFSFNSLRAIPELPPSVERLDLSGNSGLLKSASRIEFPKLNSLKTLSLASNGFKTFPNLSSNGYTLEEIDLRDNEISSLTVSDLAQLCKLRRLDIDVRLLFRRENDSCACHAVAEWVKEFGIAMDNFTCPYKACSVDLTQYRSKRDTCNRKSILNRIPYIRIGIAVFVAIPVGLLLYRLISCYTSSRKIRKNTKSEQSMDDLRYA